LTRIIRRAAVAAIFAASALAQQLDVSLVDPPVLESRLAAGAVSYGQRQARIEELFHDAGCQVEEERVGKHSGNVICTLPGESESVIAVGGHFDFAEAGKGIVDDWSGASLLASLYQALKTRPRRHTFVFIAFADEEKGLVGSSRHVRNMTPEEKALTHAFVNLECLGVGPVNVWLHRAAPPLAARLGEIATTLHIPLQAVNVEQVGDDDSHPFLSAHIPVITIHSITQATWPILHTARDQINAIHFDDYYDAYKLAAYYLAYLDLKIE